MADPRDPYGGTRDNRPPDQDTGSLLRDLRSLREAAAPRPGVARPASPTPPPKSGGSGGRLILGVLGVFVLVVGVVGYKAGVFDPVKTVQIGTSPSPGSSPSPATGASAANRPSASPGQRPTHTASAAPSTIATGLVPSELGMHFALATFLLHRFDPAVKPVDQFAQASSAELLAASGGGAVWFSRDASRFPDVLSVVSAAATPPCTTPRADWRKQVVIALAQLGTVPGTPVDGAYALISTGAPGDAVKQLTGSASTAPAHALALALAMSANGAPLAEVDTVLAGVTKPSGFVLALRAHLALMQEKREDATRLLTEVNSAATLPDELYLAAGLAFRMGNLEVTTGLLERVLTTAPKDAYALYWRGLVAERKGRADDAHKKYEEALHDCTDPKLLTMGRIRRSLLHQKAGNAPEIADLEWRGAEDFEPHHIGVLIAHAQSTHAEALTKTKLSERVQQFQEALERWQRLIVVIGPTEELMGRFLSCYAELKDQGNAREGIQFLTLLTTFGLITEDSLKSKVAQTLDVLKDRVRPRAIWEQPPK